MAISSVTGARWDHETERSEVLAPHVLLEEHQTGLVLEVLPPLRGRRGPLDGGRG